MIVSTQVKRLITLVCSKIKKGCSKENKKGEIYLYKKCIFYKIFLKRTGTTCKKYSWHASNMADDLAFQITYSSMKQQQLRQRERNF